MSADLDVATFRIERGGKPRDEKIALLQRPRNSARWLKSTAVPEKQLLTIPPQR